jgi:hypothetical protein
MARPTMPVAIAYSTIAGKIVTMSKRITEPQIAEVASQRWRQKF